jgi:hypothetical protein
MRDSSRIAYAQARVQARFSTRPTEAFWRELEAGRELPHLLEIVRPSSLGAALGSVAATANGHALEAQLRRHWVGACDEIAAWYPPDWQGAMRWLSWLPWVAGLQWLAQDRPAPSWMAGAPYFDGLVATEAEQAQGKRLPEGPLAPLATAYAAGEDLAPAWRSHWRSQWPTADVQLLRGLGRLDAALEAFLPGTMDPQSAPFDVAVEIAQAAIRRVFRRFAGTPVAGMALLLLLALDHLRLRAALTVACWFTVARTA